jgi:predicted nucleic acid-binding protein
MIVADTSALVSLASVDLLDTLLTEFDVHTTETVVDELADTSDYDDTHGHAAQTVLDNQERISIQRVDGTLESSRIDRDEGSCALLARGLDASFLLTDDLHALPELQTAVDAQVAISPIVLKALVERDVLDRQAALTKLEQLAERRSWLGRPIYRRARSLFE